MGVEGLDDEVGEVLDAPFAVGEIAADAGDGRGEGDGHGAAVVGGNVGARVRGEFVFVQGNLGGEDLGVDYCGVGEGYTVGGSVLGGQDCAVGEVFEVDDRNFASWGQGDTQQ